jgi:aspartate/methionine/tyrosine aminotransferase
MSLFNLPDLRDAWALLTPREITDYRDALYERVLYGQATPIEEALLRIVQGEIEGRNVQVMNAYIQGMSPEND